MNKFRSRELLARIFVVLIVTGMALNSYDVAAQDNWQGPPTVHVEVVNTPLPVTGSVTSTISGTVNGKIVPTTTPVSQVGTPTCDVLNRCSVKFSMVPTGKRFRVTRIFGAMYFSNVDAFVALDVNDLNSQLFLGPLHPFAAAYSGHNPQL